jgi:hypothetical protein
MVNNDDEISPKLLAISAFVRCELNIAQALYSRQRQRVCGNGLPATNNSRTKTSDADDAKFMAS